MNKGERTKQTILEQGLKYSSRYGLSEVTIGTISKLCNMSRTGVISHFKNKEDMQISILKHTEAMFIQRVFEPAWHEDPLVHIKNLLENWANWTSEMYNDRHLSCPFVKAVVEYQNVPVSNVRNFVVDQQTRLIGYLTHRVKRCMEKKRLTESVSSDSIAYELYSLYLGHAIAKNSVAVESADALFKDCVARLLARYEI